MRVAVTPIIVDALKMVPKGLVKRLEELKIKGRIIQTIQTTASQFGKNTEKSPGDLG